MDGRALEPATVGEQPTAIGVIDPP